MLTKSRARPPEQRVNTRFNKAFPVLVGSELYGDVRGVARNISAGGMFVELAEPPPIGSVVSVHFRIPGTGESMVARAEVKHHYCFNFATGGGPRASRGVGLRFVEFVDDSGDRLRSTFTRYRTLN